MRDTPLWSQQFDEPFSEVSEVQEHIARSIVDKLRGRLATDSATIMHRRSRSAEAHDLVLRARYLQGGDTRCRAGGRFAAGARAVAGSGVRGGSGDAGARLSAACRPADQTHVPGSRTLSAGEALRLARVAAARAVQLDSTSSTARTALGALAFRYDWDWELAERELRRGIQLNPGAADAQVLLARFLRSMGRFDEARRTLDRAAELARDPASDGRVVRTDLVLRPRLHALGAGARARRPRRAVLARLVRRRARRDGPSPSGRFSASLGGDALEDSESLLRRVEVLARMGRPTRPAICSGRPASKPGDFPTLVAGALIATGDTSAALSEVERAVKEHDPLVVDFAVEPRFDGLRAHPRFASIVGALRFPD